MAIVIFSRRGIHYQTGSGGVRALFVPAADQVVSYRDAGANPQDIAQRSGVAGRKPLWRQERGEVWVYGQLLNDLAQRRQAVEVWLASDFMPADADAFFLVFSQSWVIHGTKEIDDERRETWRTILLHYDPSVIVSQLTANVADVMLDGNRQNIVVAIDGNVKEYQQFKEALEAYNITPRPFSSLKPQSRIGTLYKHGDYTIPMVIALSLAVMVVIAMAVWSLKSQKALADIKERIQITQQEISQVQVNKSLGHIQDPTPILARIEKRLRQQPSAILDAAGRYAAIFGDLKMVQFTPSGHSTDADRAQSGELAQITADPYQQIITVETAKPYAELLDMQEKTALKYLPQVPWIREVVSVQSGDQSKLQLLMQIESPDVLVVPAASGTVPTLTPSVGLEDTIDPSKADRLQVSKTEVQS